MEVVSHDDGRRAMRFGEQKINMHRAGAQNSGKMRYADHCGVHKHAAATRRGVMT
jgi:hypothetical protein